MNNRGTFFLAFFTVVAVFVFVIFVSMNKERILEKTKIVDVGKNPERIINFTLDEENIKFFLDKAVEYASFNALRKLGDEGGILTGQNCERINEHVIWKGDCFFSDNLQENFFSRFKIFFDDYIKAYSLDKISADWRIDENNNFVIEVKDVVELKDENLRYGFEPDTVYDLDYDFSDYNKILSKANDCVRDEEDKGVTRNNLFEDCRNDKDYIWGIKVEGKYVLFDVSKSYKNLGNVVVKFAIPHNQ